MVKPMIERFVKVSWKINTKTGTAEDITIDMRASAMEEATAACIMARLRNHCPDKRQGKGEKMPAGNREACLGCAG